MYRWGPAAPREGGRELGDDRTACLVGTDQAVQYDAEPRSKVSKRVTAELTGGALTSPFATWMRVRRARKKNWDPDIVRGLQLPVPKLVQQRAHALIQEKKWREAIAEIGTTTGYDAVDSRCVALALMYSWKVPTTSWCSRITLHSGAKKRLDDGYR